LVDGVALDVHAQDLARTGHRLGGALGELDAAGLASTADLDLRLHDHASTQLLGRFLRVRWVLDDDAQGDRYIVVGEELFRLVLHEVHGLRLYAVSTDVNNRVAGYA
jgi:hypothetical protein